MNLLLLGGTRDGKLLARHLHQLGVPVIYSLAGLARTPDITCRIVNGGFEPHGGLSRYVKEQGINAILDATHPYAANISAAAFLATRANKIPYWQWQRDEWKPQPMDSWVEFDNWEYLVTRLSHYQSVFFTLGRIPDSIMDYCLKSPAIRFTIRSATELDRTLTEKLKSAPHIHVLQSFGPFTLADEIRLFQQHGIDALVCKNSGGDATEAKLQVARNLGLPVFMLKRPKLPLADKSFNDLNQCGLHIKTFFDTLCGADNAI